jgi:hypothetical protein
MRAAPQTPDLPSHPISATQFSLPRDGWVAPISIAQMVPPIFCQLGQVGGWHQTTGRKAQEPKTPDLPSHPISATQFSLPRDGWVAPILDRND